MRTLKIAVLAGLVGLACACEDPNFVPRGEYESLLKEYAELQESSAASREEFAAQASAMDDILQELSRISGSTVALRSDVEHGTARLTQVEQIENSIDGIKSQLGQLDKLSRDNKELQKMVKSLRTVINQKEKEIDQLKEEIRQKDLTISEQSKTISEQHGTIASQNETITTQRENLRALLSEQAQMLFQAGVDFEELGDTAPEVSRRKDKKKIEDFREEMYRKAILYYQQALQAGYPEAAYRISQIEEKRSIQ